MTDEQELVKYVIMTELIDESGDASLIRYLQHLNFHNMKVPTETHDLLTDYLIWANGADWRNFLDNADVGDTPHFAPPK